MASAYAFALVISSTKAFEITAACWEKVFKKINSGFLQFYFYMKKYKTILPVD